MSKVWSGREIVRLRAKEWFSVAPLGRTLRAGIVVLNVVAGVQTATAQIGSIVGPAPSYQQPFQQQGFATGYPQQGFGTGFPQQGLPGQTGQPGIFQAPPAGQLVFTSISDRAGYVRSPYRSRKENELLLESIGLRLSLGLGYRAAGELDRAWRLKDERSVKLARYFVKEGNGVVQTLEVGLAESAPSGFDLMFYGEQAGPTPVPNPDFQQFQELGLKEMTRVAQLALSLDSKQLGYHTYNLSYADSDRAIGLLKALGYTTIEYAGDPSENPNEKIYRPIQQGGGQLPVVVKLIDPTKTSLSDPASSGGGGALASGSSVPEIGGTYLHHGTSGEPDQRLLVMYDKQDPESLQNLLNLIRETIDLPARQIMIEAVVLEVSADASKTLGTTFSGTRDTAGVGFGQTNSAGVSQPFLATLDTTLQNPLNFKAQLSALISQNKAQVLSSPSVLVLDGRQAKVQIGQQVPVVKSTSTQAGVVSSVDYFPVGIVLNLRPRISEDGREVTMQAETVVSSVNSFESAKSGGVSQVFLAPVVDNRQVQTLVRVSNDTPFIIGGLISTQVSQSKTGIPLLGELPGVGWLFSQIGSTKTKREVIVVVTPHVIPTGQRNMSYVMPKDSDSSEQGGLADRLNQGLVLFRDAYRVQAQDMLDLSIVTKSKSLQELRDRLSAAVRQRPELNAVEAIAGIREGRIPGEDILVRRMIWDIVRRLRYSEYVPTERVMFFEGKQGSANGEFPELLSLKQLFSRTSGKQPSVLLRFDEVAPTAERPFVVPSARVEPLSLTDGSLARVLGPQKGPGGEVRSWSIPISTLAAAGALSPLQMLQAVMVMRQVLALNQSMPLTLREFHIGRQILFPAPEELLQRDHVIDNETAKLFYEVHNYATAFTETFNHEAQRAMKALETPAAR